MVVLLALAGVARADTPEFQLDGKVEWQLFWYPKALPAEPEHTIDWYANGARGEFAVIREENGEYVTSRNQILLEPRLQARWGEAGAVAEVQFRYDFSDKTRARILLKDLYADIRAGSFYASAGNQTLRWGRMDIFSPVDVLTPKDFEDPFIPEALAAPSVQLKYSLSAISFQGVWLPGFVPSRYPAFAPNRWNVLIPQPRTMHQPGGTAEIATVYMGMEEEVLTAIDDPNPDDEISPLEFQLGFRADLSLGRGDLGLSLYHGRDHLPTWYTYDILNAEGIDDFSLISQGEADVSLTPIHGHVSMVGLDGNLVLGPLVVKAEAAYTSTADPEGKDCAVHDAFLKWAAGAEFAREDLGGGLGLAIRVEVSGDHDLPRGDGVQNTAGQCLEQEDFSDVLLYDPKHLNQFALGGQVALRLPIPLVVDLRGYASQEKDWMFRAEIRYTFLEKVRFTVAGMMMGGSENGVSDGRPGYFWWYRDNDRLELSAAYLF